MEENPVFVDSLFLLQWLMKYKQQILEAIMDIIKPWRLVKQAVEAAMDAVNVIKPWNFVSNLLGWLEAKWDAGTHQWTCHGNRLQGRVGGEKPRGEWLLFTRAPPPPSKLVVTAWCVDSPVLRLLEPHPPDPSSECLGLLTTQL